MSSLPGFSKWRYKTRRRGRRSLVFWKAPDFSAGAVKPINMIDGERDACPALLALYHPFVWHTHFPGFQSEKYIYRILGFGKVLAALSRLRWRAQQSISRGSLGVQGLDITLASSSLQHVLTRLSRGFTEEYSRRRFPFVRPLFDSLFDWQNPTFKRAENLIKLNIQIGGNLSKPDF